MLDLTIAETSQFYELTGVTYTKAQQAFAPRPCGPHRVAIKACKPCAKPGVMFCPEHLEEYKECPNCLGAGQDTPEAWLAAVVYLVRKRDGQEKRTWEEFTTQVKYTEMTAALVELGNAQGEPGPASTARGSRRSSTGTRGSKG